MDRISHGGTDISMAAGRGLQKIDHAGGNWHPNSAPVRQPDRAFVKEATCEFYTSR